MASSLVKADIIPLFNAATPVAGGCEFSYDVNIADGSRVNTGDYFTIYDFNGLVSGSEFFPADWAVSEQLVGITPAGVDPSAFSGDSAGVMNITFTYTGAATLFGPTTVGGPAAFGATSATCFTTGLGTYASAAHKNNPGHPDDNTAQNNAGFTVTPAAIPESSSLMLLVPGLVPLSILLRRRARKE
jgi:hypothetical protein